MRTSELFRLPGREDPARSTVTELHVQRPPFGPVTLTQTEAESILETEFAQLVTHSEANWLRFYIDNASLHYSLKIALQRCEDGTLNVLEPRGGVYRLTR